MKFLADEGLILSKPRAARAVNAPGQVRRSQIRTITPRVILIGECARSGKTDWAIPRQGDRQPIPTMPKRGVGVVTACTMKILFGEMQTLLQAI